MIPIKNIYYMLCYAWENILRQQDESHLDTEAFDNIYNLLSFILIREVSKIIKGGFVKGYIGAPTYLSSEENSLDNTLKKQALVKANNM